MRSAKLTAAMLVALLISLTLVFGLGRVALAATDYDGDGATDSDCKPLDPAVHPGATDHPDLAFEDLNCDGIDGDPDDAFFVQPSGSDANVGTPNAPFQTLQKAVNEAAASATKKSIYIATGSYGRASLPTTADGVRIYGGYAAGTWTRTTSTTTVVSGQPEALLLDGARDVVLQLVEVSGSRGTGLNAYGVRAINGSELALIRSKATAGAGGQGGTGAGGSTPGKAASGDPGNMAPNCDTSGTGGVVSQLGNGTDGGAGGRGGEETNDGENGSAGTKGSGTGGGAAGAGGIDIAGDTHDANDGMHGQPGGQGTAGAAGSSGSGGGSDLGAAGVAWAGRNGGDGANGGSGRGDCGITVGNGGNGGPGGPGGKGGDGGGGSGGPSAALMRIGTSNATDRDSTLTNGSGGAGGSGGGAAGQSGQRLPSTGSAATDFDGDGITDSSDACVEIPRGADGNGDGCPDRPAALADGDGDGVPDNFDACPTVAADTADGCPPDTTAPNTTITSGPPSLTRSTSASLSFTSTEAGSRFQCGLDGAAFTSCASPKSYTNLKNGSHTFKVRAIDAAGNVDATPAVRTWKVDTIKPTISGMSPRHTSAIRDTTPTIKATVKDNLTNLAKANIKLYVNGKLVSPTKYSYSAATDVLTYNSPRLSKGKKTIKIVATDAARNVGTKSWYFTIK